METAKVTFENDNTKIIIDLKFDKTTENLEYNLDINPHEEGATLDFPGFLAQMFLNSLNS